MTRFLAARLLAPLVCVLMLGPVLGQPTTQTDPWVGDWIADVPGIGKLALELRPQYEGRRTGELFWLFETVPVRWESKGDRLTLLSSPSNSNVPSESLMIFKRGVDGRLHFSEGGVLTGARFGFFRDVTFTPAAKDTSKDSITTDRPEVHGWSVMSKR